MAMGNHTAAICCTRYTGIYELISYCMCFFIFLEVVPTTARRLLDGWLIGRLVCLVISYKRVISYNIVAIVSDLFWFVAKNILVHMIYVFKSYFQFYLFSFSVWPHQELIMLNRSWTTERKFGPWNIHICRTYIYVQCNSLLYQIMYFLLKCLLPLFVFEKSVRK